MIVKMSGRNDHHFGEIGGMEKFNEACRLVLGTIYTITLKEMREQKMFYSFNQCHLG